MRAELLGTRIWETVDAMLLLAKRRQIGSVEEHYWNGSSDLVKKDLEALKRRRFMSPAAKSCNGYLLTEAEPRSKSRTKIARKGTRGLTIKVEVTA
jgi:hypothetical protein